MSCRAAPPIIPPRPQPRLVGPARTAARPGWPPRRTASPPFLICGARRPRQRQLAAGGGFAQTHSFTTEIGSTAASTRLEGLQRGARARSARGQQSAPPVVAHHPPHPPPQPPPRLPQRRPQAAPAEAAEASRRGFSPASLWRPQGSLGRAATRRDGDIRRQVGAPLMQLNMRVSGGCCGGAGRTFTNTGVAPLWSYAWA